MTVEHAENELSGWFSTYGLITAQRILERYTIKLPTDDLLQALKTPDSFYHRLMRVPLRNVFNGIILQQTRDYQLYAQKLFIDYLLSGESGKTEESPGAGTREDIEHERKNLIQMTENFHEAELAHERLIAESQATLMKDAKDWNSILVKNAKNIKANLQAYAIVKSDNTILQALIKLLTNYDFKGNFKSKKDTWVQVEEILGTKLTPEGQEAFTKEINKLSQFTSETEPALAEYSAKIKEMGMNLRQMRAAFYDFIIHANELLKLLPEYKIDNPQIEENREALRFDSALGGTSTDSV